MWIKKMVNKEVEKQIAALRSDLVVMLLYHRDKIINKLEEQLRERLRDAIQRPPNYTQLDNSDSDTQSKSTEEESAEDTDEDEEDEDKSVRPKRTKTLDISISLSDTDSIGIVLLYSDSTDDSMSDGEIRDVCNEAPTNLQSNHKFSSAGTSDTSQVIKELEEEISSNLFHSNPSFRASNIRHEEERVEADKINEEGAFLMESQWKEWMDRQEMRRNHKANPSEQQGEAPPQVTEAQIRKPLKAVDTMNKVKSRLCHFFNPHPSHRWERFEDED